MAVLSEGDIWLVKVFCFAPVENQVSVNLFHYRCISQTGDPFSDAFFASSMDTNFGVLWRTILGTQDAYKGVTVQGIEPLPVTEYVTNGDNAGVGVLSAARAPSQTSLVVTKLTGFAGRKERGRTYMPFPPAEAVQSNGFPTVAYQTLCQAIGDQIAQTVTLTAIGSETKLIPVIYHGITSTPPKYSPISHCRANDLFGTQRRRGNYGANNLPPLIG